MRRRVVTWGALIGLGVLLVTGPALAGDLPPDLSSGREQCEKCITGLKTQLARVTRWGNIWVLVGVVVASASSLAAGATQKGKMSVGIGALGVVGALITAIPKTLPDRAELQRRISLADQHRVHGEKTVLQMSTFDDRSFVSECQRYALSRYVDCSADEPAGEVPDLPGHQLVAMSSTPAGQGQTSPEVAAAAVAAPRVRHHVAPAAKPAPRIEDVAPSSRVDAVRSARPMIEAE